MKEANELLNNPEARRLENVFKRSLELYVRDLRRRKLGSKAKPRKSKRPKSPHTITTHALQEVWERDGGQCTFVNDEGRRCPSRGGLEFDHVRAKGRAAFEGVTTALTASDVQLLCAAHNQLMAERLYGDEFMRHKRDSARSARATSAAASPSP